MNKTWFKVFFGGLMVIGLCLFLTPVMAADDDAAKEQKAKESEEACAASAKDKATAEMIVKKVEEGAALVEKEGKAAFDKFKGKDSAFIFAGTYIWINDMEGVMVMHPIKHKMEGKAMLGLKDINGKLFFVDMIKVAREKGTGWVDYMWPKPGEKDPSLKVSYVKKCKIDGVDMVIGCGVYGITPEEAKKLTGQ